jgi:hypothetical protein
MRNTLYQHRIFWKNENIKNQRTLYVNHRYREKTEVYGQFIHCNIYVSVKLGLKSNFLTGAGKIIKGNGFA